jgi:hypothetical protein
MLRARGAADAYLLEETNHLRELANEGPETSNLALAIATEFAV